MRRPAARTHGTAFIVTVAACALALSVIGSAGYALFCDDSLKSLTTPMLNRGEPQETTDGEETDFDGSSLVAIDMALCDACGPRLLPPQDGGKILPVTFHIKRSAFQTGIFRPPIA